MESLVVPVARRLKQAHWVCGLCAILVILLFTYVGILFESQHWQWQQSSGHVVQKYFHQDCRPWYNCNETFHVVIRLKSRLYDVTVSEQAFTTVRMGDKLDVRYLTDTHHISHLRAVAAHIEAPMTP